MLETQDRQLFLESVRPPAGYELDHLIGTTYSLDLVTLLTLPLTFTMFDAEDESGKPLMDPIVLLEALRRNADKIDVFCQAGRIYLPQQHRGLFTYLESSVHEVMALREHGVFHPKVWIGRYVCDGLPVRYKVLVQSRNLTFDKSWDAMVCLDGEVLDRTNGISRNHPLGDFVKSLPELAVHPVSLEKAEKLELIHYELRRLDLDKPKEWEEVRFHPVGIKGYQKTNPLAGRIDRLLVISPFITVSLLEELARRARTNANNVLISRQESLAKVELQHLDRYRDEVYVLMDEANPEPEEAAEDGEQGQLQETDSEGHLERTQAGLHAKVYVADAGWDARVWLGSANATQHAFHENVEFLVELQGKKRLFGVEATLGHPDNKWSLSHLLKPYSVSSEDASEEPESNATEELEWFSRVIAATEITLQVGRPDADDSARAGEARSETEGESIYDALLRIPSLASVMLPHVNVFCKLISLPDVRYQPVLLDKPGTAEVRFKDLTIDALTSFVAFRLEDKKSGEKLTFVCNVKMEGEPEHRRDRLLKSLLTNRSQVLRYILLLLSEGDGDPLVQALMKDARDTAKAAAGENHGVEVPLLESILKTLHANPTKLAQIQHVIEQLRKSGRENLLPEGFLDVWDPIWNLAEEALQHA